MIITLIALASLLLTGEFSWLSSDTSHVGAHTPTQVITPEEPITRTLALIGIATIAVYLGVSRVLLKRRTERTTETESAAESGIAVEQPSRGAA